MRINSSSIRRAGSRLKQRDALGLSAIFVVLSCLVGQAGAFDLFTLWQQHELELRIDAGDWADYRSVTIEAGRRRTDVSRLQCTGLDDEGWRLEVVGLVQKDAGLMPVAGSGWSFTLLRDVVTREGQLMDYVRDVKQWEDGRAHSVSDDEWRNDPLLQTALSGGFEPDERREGSETTRAVGGRDLFCSSLVFTQLESETIDLPSGSLIQDFTREISVSLHDDVPFLGFVYAAERAVTESRLDPPGSRRPPPPQIRIETMELLDFGTDAGTVFEDGA